MTKEPSMYPFPYSNAARLDPRIKTPRPDIDPTLAPILDSCQLPEEVDLNFMRSWTSFCNADTVLNGAPYLKHTEHSIPGPDGNIVTLSVFSPNDPSSTALPALYHIHGGGMVAGDRFSGVGELLTILKDIECVLISVEYRLAPETRAPGPAEDCYAGLVWMSKNASVLGIDPAGIVVWGVSGGGALAAVTCLMARDRQTPAIPIRAQMLVSPMLDDRCSSASDQQFEYGSPWCGVSNRMAWGHVLGANQGTDSVTSYQAPAREEDLARLPPAYVDAAECEVFRDPAVFYAMDMWKCGSTCELHVWPGAFHLFDGTENPLVPLICAAIEAKRSWLRRMMESGNVNVEG
ncbi:Alpha/Beta hydrolase protein [Aspergillus varians]